MNNSISLFGNFINQPTIPTNQQTPIRESISIKKKN